MTNQSDKRRGGRSATLTLSSPAKINRHLYVGALQKDGYHYLETLFQEISLVDTLRFEVTPGPVWCEVSPAPLFGTGENLVVKALRMLKKKLGVSKGMGVRLHKRIPVGAGLGGGSSNAAAALLGGYALWKNRGRLPKPGLAPVLAHCARRLGSDVPFFLEGGLAWARNRGEDLFPLKAGRREWLVVVYPRVHVSTKTAYGRLDRSAPSFRALEDQKLLYFNSFEPVIAPGIPAISEALRALKERGCSGVMMSGSGSSVFGFVDSAGDGRKVLASLKTKPWDVYLAHTRTV